MAPSPTPNLPQLIASRAIPHTTSHHHFTPLATQPSSQRTMPTPAFTIPTHAPHPPSRHALPTPTRRPRPSARPPRCADNAPRKVTLFTTGKRIVVQPHRTSPTPSDIPTTRYIVCPKCASAYVGNAVTTAVDVKCAKCASVFPTSPTLLYAPFTARAPRETPRSALPDDRVVCRHFAVCPGCTVDGLAATPPVLREASVFVMRELGLSAFTSVKHASAHSWRTHAKLAVRQAGAEATPTLGLFKNRSHDLVPIPHCTVHAPEINAAAAAVETSLRMSGAFAYNDYTGKGDCRYVLLTLHRPSRKVQVTFVWNSSSWKDSTPTSQRVGNHLWRSAQKLIHSVWFNWNTSSGNSIVTPALERFYHMHGPKELVDTVLGVDIHFPPYAFRQANLDAFETLLLPDLLRYIPQGSAVAEFCAGVGVIGLVALKEKKLRSLVASEINDGAEGAFWKSLKSLRKGSRTSEVQYVVGSDSDTVNIVDEDVDVVIVDPPRAGLSPDLVQTLAMPDDMPSLKRIIYVSCGFKAFKRDARVLCAGLWRLKAAHAVILFPGSDHVEILAIFDKVQRHEA